MWYPTAVRRAFIQEDVGNKFLRNRGAYPPLHTTHPRNCKILIISLPDEWRVPSEGVICPRELEWKAIVRSLCKKCRQLQQSSCNKLKFIISVFRLNYKIVVIRDVTIKNISCQSGCVHQQMYQWLLFDRWAETCSLLNFNLYEDCCDWWYVSDHLSAGLQFVRMSVLLHQERSFPMLSHSFGEMWKMIRNRMFGHLPYW
jgi:hypothetical protein